MYIINMNILKEIYEKMKLMKTQDLISIRRIPRIDKVGTYVRLMEIRATV